MELDSRLGLQMKHAAPEPKGAWHVGQPTMPPGRAFSVLGFVPGRPGTVPKNGPSCSPEAGVVSLALPEIASRHFKSCHSLWSYWVHDGGL